MSECDFGRSEFLHVDVLSPAKETNNLQKTICCSSLGTTSIGQRKEEFPALMDHSGLSYVQ